MLGESLQRNLPFYAKIGVGALTLIGTLIATVPPYIGLPLRVEMQGDTLRSHGEALTSLRDESANHSDDLKQLLCLMNLSFQSEDVLPGQVMECGQGDD